MSAKSKRRRKARRALARTADSRAAAMRARMLRGAAERERIRDAVRDGTATDDERKEYEDRRRLFDAFREALPENVLYDGLVTWEALEKIRASRKQV